MGNSKYLLALQWSHSQMSAQLYACAPQQEHGKNEHQTYFERLQRGSFFVIAFKICR